MKHLLTGLSAAAIVLLAASGASAQYQNGPDHGHGGPPPGHGGPPHGYHQGPPPHQRYHQGQVWHGHHLAYRNNHWGYYQPRNGVQVFINVPL